MDGLGLPVVAGFSTHLHWDHLLWHPRFGDVPRYATAANAQAAGAVRERAQAMAAESALGHPARADRAGDPAARRRRTRARRRSSSTRRTPSATRLSSSRTGASCSPATCSPTS